MIRKTLILIATISILAVRNANAEFVKALETSPSQKRTNEKLEQIKQQFYNYETACCGIHNLKINANY